jgi:hypothetical protein
MGALHLRFIVTAVAIWIIGTARVFAAGDAGVPAISPTEALERLMAGNERFENDKTGHPVLHSNRREELVGGQSPFAVILSCSDSRVRPELIFDQGWAVCSSCASRATRSPALVSRVSITRSRTWEQT